jgi:two-component system phosphate regulon sensor histidine kinase PhoR
MYFANKNHNYFLILYGIIAFFGVWGITTHAETAAHLTIKFWAALGAVGAAGAMLEILIHLRIRKALNQMKEQIERMSRNADVGLVMIDEQNTVEGMPVALNQYLTLLGERINQLKKEYKELDLLVRAVDAEKHNTEAIIRNISDAVVVINAFGELVLANHQAEELLGFEFARSKNQFIGEVISDSVLVQALTPERCKTSNQVVRFEYTLKKPGSDKSGIYMVTVTPVYIEKGELWAMAMTFQDVTQEREVARMKNEFVNHVSHELRTPLSSIKAYIELLLDQDVPSQEDQISFYRIIQAEADRLDHFIANMLNLSRIESGLMAVEFTEVQPDEEVRQSINLVRFIAEEKSITLDYVPPEESFSIRADRDLFRQVILNLLSNAIKYTPNGGSIKITCSYDVKDETCRIDVQDSGVGIAESDRERIFDKFYRCTGRGRELSGGTGLGLTLVKKVVEEIHHGQVRVGSDPGRGSIFTVILPINPIACDELRASQEVMV